MPPVQPGAQWPHAKEDDQSEDIQRMTPAEARYEPGVEKVEQKSAEEGPGAYDAYSRAARAHEPVADEAAAGTMMQAMPAATSTKRQVVVPEHLGATGKRQACSQEKSPDSDENLRPETVVEMPGQG
jgi:hypothetical protein